tara:strand:- start:36 stop:230 length:195 start_codon:yes stop_codon:yes gene_type:complete
MQYRQHIIRKLENLESKLKHIEFHNNRGNREEIEKVRKECEDLLEEITSTIGREPQSSNEINRT